MAVTSFSNVFVQSYINSVRLRLHGRLVLLLTSWIPVRHRCRCRAIAAGRRPPSSGRTYGAGNLARTRQKGVNRVPLGMSVAVLGGAGRCW